MFLSKEYIFDYDMRNIIHTDLAHNQKQSNSFLFFFEEKHKPHKNTVSRIFKKKMDATIISDLTELNTILEARNKVLEERVSSLQDHVQALEDHNALLMQQIRLLKSEVQPQTPAEKPANKGLLNAFKDSVWH